MLAQVLAAIFMTSWGTNYLTGLGDLRFGTSRSTCATGRNPFHGLRGDRVINSVDMFDGPNGLAGARWCW